MSSSFGGSAICPRCDKTVYQAEQIMGPGRKFYHKPCLSCMTCKKRLDSLSLLEHDQEPYCKSCHSKNFGTHNPGHRNVDPLLTPPRKVPIGVTLSESPKSTALETSPVNAVAERYATAAAIQRRHMTGDGIDSTSPRPIPRSLTGGSPSPRRTFGVDNPKCARCTKAVYFAEQVKAVGKIFHKGCLRCVECNTLLDSNRLRDHDGEPLCASCHTKLHGPQGLRK